MLPQNASISFVQGIYCRFSFLDGHYRGWRGASRPGDSRREKAYTHIDHAVFAQERRNRPKSLWNLNSCLTPALLPITDSYFSYRATMPIVSSTFLILNQTT